MLFYTEQWYGYFVIHQRMFSKLFVNSKQATDGSSKKIQHFIQESSCTFPSLVPFLCCLSKYWILQNQVIVAESLLLLQFFEFSLSWERWVGTSLLKHLQFSTDVFESVGKYISCHVFSWNVVKYLTRGKAFFQCPEINSLFFHPPSPPQTFVGCFRAFDFRHEFQWDIGL